MTADSKSTFTSRSFHRLAVSYRLVNRILSFGLDWWWRRAAVKALELEPGGRWLDVGCGTGEMFQVASFDHMIKVGVDPDAVMLRNGRSFGRSEVAVMAVGEGLPFLGESFNYLTSAFVLRNLDNRHHAFEEFRRVLIRRGQGALLEFTMPRRGLISVPARMYLKHILPRLGGALSGEPDAYRYLLRTMEAFPPPSVIVEELERAGFANVRYRLLAGGVAVLYTFHRP